jgi:dihydrofolate reductase
MKVVLYPAITLDGFIADLDGECYSWISDADEEIYNQAITKAGCVLVGRKTFEQYPEDFPKKDALTFVYTSKEEKQGRAGIMFIHGDPHEVIQQIAEHGFSQLIVCGGGEVNGAIAEAGLVDEIMISIYNVTIGEGIPLFGSHRPKLKLKLLSTASVNEGIVSNHYEVEK